MRDTEHEPSNEPRAIPVETPPLSPYHTHKPQPYLAMS